MIELRIIIISELSKMRHNDTTFIANKRVEREGDVFWLYNCINVSTHSSKHQWIATVPLDAWILRDHECTILFLYYQQNRWAIWYFVWFFKVKDCPISQRHRHRTTREKGKAHLKFWSVSVLFKNLRSSHPQRQRERNLKSKEPKIQMSAYLLFLGVFCFVSVWFGDETNK